MQHTQWVVDKLENVDDICILLGSIEDSDKGRIPSIWKLEEKRNGCNNN